MIRTFRIAGHEKHAIFINAQRRVVNAIVIVLRTVKDDGPSLKCIRVIRIGQISGSEHVGNHTEFHDGRSEKIAAYHLETRMGCQRIVPFANDIRILARQLSPIDLPFTVIALSWMSP